MNKMIYQIDDIPPLKQILIYAIQQVASVIVATVLISDICGTPINSALFGAGVGTLTYQLITKFKSPMFISSSGATAGAVIGALALGSGNYAFVMIGGLVIFLTYIMFAFLVKRKGIEVINSLFPKTVIGSITCVIGINLMGYISSYTMINGEASYLGVGIALLVAAGIALISIYGKGFITTIPFLFVILIAYIFSAILTKMGIVNLVDFSALSFASLFSMPDFAFLNCDFAAISIVEVVQLVAIFLPVALAAMMEHYTDTKVMSNLIGVDLMETPGLHRTLIADGCASFIGTIVAGQPNTTYSESTSTTAFCKVASVRVITVAAFIMILMSFFNPVQAFFNGIPSCVFAGASIILYGFITLNGVKLLMEVDYTDQRNVLLVCITLSTGISGIAFLNNAFAGVSLAMIFGLVMHQIIKFYDRKFSKNK